MYLRHPVRSPSRLRHEDAKEQVRDLLPYRGDVAIHEGASGSWDRLRRIPSHLSEAHRHTRTSLLDPYLKSDGNGQPLRAAPPFSAVGSRLARLPHNSKSSLSNLAVRVKQPRRAPVPPYRWSD